MKQKKQIQSINALLIISLLMLSACQIQQSEVTVNQIVIPVVKGAIDSSIDMVGYVQYNQSAELSWKTDGVIENVAVKVGDNVTKGELLADLEVSSLNSSVILAEKNMIEAQDKLEDVKGSSTEKMTAYTVLNEKESALQQAQREQEALYYPRADQQTLEWAYDDYALANLNFNYAKQDYDNMVANNESWDSGGYPVSSEIFNRRTNMTETVTTDMDKSSSARERVFNEYVDKYETLVDTYETFTWENSTATNTEFAVAEGNVQIAQKDYDQALEDYLSYENLPREKDLVAAEIALTAATNNYNKRNILATFDGTVTSVNAQEGYYIKRGDVALRIDDLSRMFVPINISEIDVSNIYNGQKASIKLDAMSEKVYSGKVYKINEAGTNDNSITSFNAMIELVDPDDQIKAGMTAEVSLMTEEKTDALLVPNSAILFENGKNYLTLPASPENQKVEVQLGIVSDNISEIISGSITEGTEIVVNELSANILQELGLDPMQYLTTPERADRAADSIPASPEQLPQDADPLHQTEGSTTADSEKADQTVTASEEASEVVKEDYRPQVPADGQRMPPPQGSGSRRRPKEDTIGQPSDQSGSSEATAVPTTEVSNNGGKG